MSLLVRKINRSKWFQTNIYEGEDISGDAITNCLKTTRNTLSTWRINSETEIEDAILAMASGFDHIDTIDVIPINPEHLESEGISLTL